LGQTRVMNQYLNDMLADSLYRSGKLYRDDHHHPLITDILTAGNMERPTFQRDWFCNTQDWIRACESLSYKEQAIRIMALAASKERTEPAQALEYRNRPRRSSSCANEKETSTRDIISSPASAKLGRKGSLDQCIKQTANMDLSTMNAAQTKFDWLAKEIRGARKLLNQILKLQESLEVSVEISSQQREKIERRPLLESKLFCFETALALVEKRMAEFITEEEKNTSSPTKKERTKEAVIPEGAEMEEEPSYNQSFACEICGIKCPDETSYELHQNGRKHRNRVAQVAEDEKKKAVSIMEKHQLQQVMSAPASAPAPPKKPINAWKTSQEQPKYKLPPPPHPAVSQVTSIDTSTSRPRKSRAIKAIPISVALPRTLQPIVTPTKKTDFRAILKQEAERSSVTMPKKPQFSPASLHKSPVWAISPGTTRCLPMNLLAPAADGQQRNSYSLGDFLAPKPQAVLSPKTAVVAPWLSPKDDGKKMNSAAKSLREIQEEEVDFKNRQDQSFGKDAGSWFIERRERAGSMRAIQDSAEKDREEQMMIEEQIRIEAQIKQEVALAQQREKEKQDVDAKKPAPKKKKNQPRAKKNSSENGDEKKGAKAQKPNPGGNKTVNHGGKSKTKGADNPSANSNPRNQSPANEDGSPSKTGPNSRLKVSLGNKPPVPVVGVGIKAV
jgi:hypothetical protein